jgi:TPR repeat protein
MYEKGTMAAFLYHLAVAQNHVGAKFKMGYMYDTGDSIPSDKANAQEYFNSAIRNS